MAITNFNYDLASNQARDIQKIANDMRSLNKRKIDTAIKDVGNVWKGDAATLYLQHMMGTCKNIEDIAKELESIAVKIKQVAGILKKADDDAKALQQRKN